MRGELKRWFRGVIGMRQQPYGCRWRLRAALAGIKALIVSGEIKVKKRKRKKRKKIKKIRKKEIK